MPASMPEKPSTDGQPSMSTPGSPGSTPGSPDSPDSPETKGKGNGAAPIGDQVMDMLQSVEAQLDKLKNLPRAPIRSDKDSSEEAAPDSNQIAMLQSQIAALEEALQEASVAEEDRATEREKFQQKMEEKQVELDSARSMIVQLQSQAPAASPEELAELKDDVKLLQDQLGEREKVIVEQQNHLTQAGEKLSAFSEVLSEQYEQSKGTAAQAELVKDQKVEIEGLKAKLDQALESIEQHKAKMMDGEQVVRNLAERDQEVEHLKSELEKARESSQQQSAELESGRQQDAEEHAKHLAERDGEVEHLKSELEKARESSQQQSAELESGRQQDAEEHANHLAERDGEVERLKSELSEIKESLQEQSSQWESAKQQDAEQVASQLTERDGEIERLKSELEKALESSQEESAQQAKTEQMAGQLAEQDRELEALKAELEQLRAKEATGGDGNSDVAESLRNRIAELEATLKERDDSEEMAELQDKVDTLEKELKEARENPGGNEAEAVLKLRDKAQRIQEVAEHLRNRRSRLKRMRALLKGGPPSTGNVMADLENRSSQMRKVENRHRELIELKASLEASERMMIRRWGRAKSGSIVVWCLVLAIVVAGISWIAAAVYFPPTLAASVTINAKTRSTSPLTEEEARSWANWHEKFLGDPVFAEAAAKRMKDRKLEQYAMAPALSARMQDQLGIDHTKPGEMVLTLTGKDKEETLTVLDVVANTLAKESARKVGTREGSVWATVRSTGKSGGHMRFASLNPVLIDDHRMTWMGIIFAGAYCATLGLIILVYGKLVKAKRVFDDEEEAMIRQGDASTPAA